MSDARCEGQRELVSAFVDERLEGAELLALEAHLEACAGCRRFEADLRRFPELLLASEAFRPLRQPPPGFAAQVAARAAAEQTGRVVPFPAPARRRRASLLGFAAAAAAAALFFAWSWQRLLPGEPVAQQAQIPAPQTATFAVAQVDEGSMDDWLQRHASLARDATLLGPAEEFEFAGSRPAAGER